jgi:RNA polymerase sigma-B factor
LINAIDRFDLERGFQLTPYAVANIVGQIKRHFRDTAWSVHVPRGLRDLSVQLSQLVEQLTAELGRSPTTSELASAADLKEQTIIEALQSSRAYNSVSLSALTGSKGGELDQDRLLGLAIEDVEYEAAEYRDLLARGIQALDEREREILRLRFFKGLTQAEIAQEVDLSQMHVSRLIRSSLAKIGEAIAPDEEASLPS